MPAAALVALAFHTSRPNGFSTALVALWSVADR
ncbi:MAG: hypothetical protein QOH14_3688, partial [Pseudonocardiales bacterium]|nr:hypothetical protein [Pseudonocardiales bacterium]